MFMQHFSIKTRTVLRRIIGGVALLLVVGTAVQCFSPSDDREAEAAPAEVAAGPEDLGAALSAAGARDTGIAGEDLFRQGIAFIRAGDNAAALRTFDEVVRSSPGLIDWATYFSAQAAANMSDTTQARARLAKLALEFRNGYAWRAAVTAYEKAKAPQRAAAVADSFAKNMKGARRYDALYEAARLRSNRAGLNLVLDSGTTATRMKAATELMKFTRLTADERISIARAQRASGRPHEALDSYKKANTTLAKYERAQLLFALRRYKNAVAQAEPVVASKTARGAEAQLLQARANLRLDNVTKARTSLRSLIDRREASSLTRAGAAFMLGDLAQDASNDADARRYFRRAIDAYPASEPAALAYMRLGLDAFVDGKHSEAARIFEEYRKAHAKTNFAPQAAYWAGRARAALKQDSAAKAHMSDVVELQRFSYYGLLAADYLEHPKPSLPKGPTTPDAVEKQVRGSLQRIALLNDLDLYEAASYEQSRTREFFGDKQAGLHFLAEELQKNGRVSDGIAIGRRLYDDDGSWNERTLRLIYPFPYEDVIKEHARARDVDPYMIAALIRQESSFNPRAKSSAGALGLMQVMPRTGAAVARVLGLSNFRTALLTDPEVNVRIGVRHFSNLLREYDGHMEQVIASYNAGATPVGRWRRIDHNNDPQIFTDRIPYDETREYVKILLRNTRMYKLLYS
jgi:soluble lytic murein transglycosylase